MEGFDVNNYKWLDKQPNCLYRDWLSEGKVGYPRDQLTCGSCWAQTTVSAVETMRAIKKHVFDRDDVPEYSVQQLVDCNLIPNMGCMGGEALYAYRYVKENGLALEKDYPYKDRLRECTYSQEDMKSVEIGDFKVFQRINNTDLKHLVCLGAVSVPFYINDCIKNYASGIITDTHNECGCTRPETWNHAVTIVGYGQDPTFVQCKHYWLIKNSWGESWGENGFMRLCREDDHTKYGTCGLRSEAILPLP